MATILKSKCSLFHILFSFTQSLFNLNMSYILPILKRLLSIEMFSNLFSTTFQEVS